MESFVDCGGLDETARAVKVLSPADWFPPSVSGWMKRIPSWYEDDHAIYVHAGLEGEGETWLHPQLGDAHNLLWRREHDFFAGYRGKRLVVGHTPPKQI